MKSARDVKASVGIVGVFLRLLLIAAAALFVTRAEAAKTFKGVLDAEGTITFYYDDVNHSAEGTVTTRGADATGHSPWESNTSITHAVFTQSCAEFAWKRGLQYLFAGCSNLESVEGLGNLNTSSATSLYMMFKNCSSLTSIDFETMDTGKVTNFGDMFYGCSSLEDLDISSFSSASAASCGNMFRDCSSLVTIYAHGDFDLSSASGNWMFSSCSRIVGGKGTTLSSTDSTYARVDADGRPGYFTLKTQTLTIGIGDFAAKHLSSVVVTNVSTGLAIEPDEVGGGVWTMPRGTEFVISYVAETGYEFSGESVYVDSTFASGGIIRNETISGDALPAATAFVRFVLTVDSSDFSTRHVSSVSVKKASTGETLQPESDGTYLMIPGEGFILVFKAEDWRAFGNYISVTNDITYSESGITSSTTVSSVPQASLLISGPAIRGVVADGDPDTLTLYYDSVLHSGTIYARKAATSGTSWANLPVKRVVVDSSMKEYGQGGDGFQYLFKGLSSVTNIEGTANLKAEKATNLTQMFNDCASLTRLDLSTFKTPLVKHFGDMFYGCSSLVELDISGFRSSVAIGCGNMFRGCSKLVTIYAHSGFDLSSASGDWMFNGCSKLVGGNGTTVTSGLRDYTPYAHVDEPGNPGYFTLKPQAGLCVILR